MKRGASCVILDLAINTGKDRKSRQKRLYELAKKCAEDAKKEGDYLRKKGLL